MAKETESYRTRANKPVIICDFTPPRGAGPDYVLDSGGDAVGGVVLALRCRKNSMPESTVTSPRKERPARIKMSIFQPHWCARVNRYYLKS